MATRWLLRSCAGRRRVLTSLSATTKTFPGSSRNVLQLRALQATLSPSTTLIDTQKRWHSGHGHSHGVLEDEESPEEKALRLKLSAADVKAADRITWVGVWLNVVLSGLKGAAGLTFHSSGLLADAAHSLSDLVSDFVTLVSLKWCSRPPDLSHPYGYGKYETIGALSVSLLLVGGSLGIMAHSLDALLVLMQPAAEAAAVLGPEEVAELAQVMDPDTLEAVKSIAHEHSHGHSHGMVMHPAAFGIAALSVVAKEIVFRMTKSIGQRVHSSVLIANAWHHRSDAVTSVVAMGGIGLSLAGFPLFDPLAGIAVGGIILKMGAEIGWDSTKELCDAKLPDATLRSLEKVVDDVVQSSHGDVLEVRQLRSRRVGRHIHVDLNLVVDGSTPAALERAVKWKQKVKSAVQLKMPRVKDIVVEISTREQVAATATTAHQHDHDHDHDHHHE